MLRPPGRREIADPVGDFGTGDLAQRPGSGVGSRPPQRDVAFSRAFARVERQTGDMYQDTERCLRAVQAKDDRFDGWFFTAVLTTGIYCRPGCPVTPPKPANMRFYPSAAAAQEAGFRACKRCRPDAVPGSPQWNIRADMVGRAMRLIADGVVDRDGVEGLARRLGYEQRQEIGRAHV